jgi:hypothetical protein
MNTGSKYRKSIAHVGIAAGIFVVATSVADFIVGPLVVRAMVIPPQTGNHPWGILVPFVIQNTLVCLGFILARKQLSHVATEARFFSSWLINAGAACAAGVGYLLLDLPKVGAPAIYRVLGGDSAAAIRSIIILVSAVLPLSTYFQIRLSDTGRE